MPYLRPSPLLLLILSVLLSVLIFSCDPDEAEKKKQPNTQDQDDNNDNNNNQPEPPPTNPTEPTKKPTPKPPIISKIPVKFLDAVGIDSGNPKDANNTVWVFQGKEITFSTTARDKDKNKIANAQFTWQWRKRGKKTKSNFGRIWTEITGQTTATATLTIPADERVGAYELRVSATSGGQKVDNHKETPYKFTVRKSGCPAPSATNQPADNTAIKALLRGKTGTPPLTDSELLRAIDTSQVNSLGSLFYNRNFNKDINCWDVSNVDTMVFMFTDNSMFNRDIGDWDTSQVTDMGGMFENASKFNQDISRWDTSQVTNMSVMFNGAAKFNQDLSGWDVSKGPFRSRFATDANKWTKAKPSWP